jgi:hypothetical protein
MGKLHRIKRSFNKVVSQDPVPLGTHRLGKCVSVNFGRSYGGGHLYTVVWNGRYEKLVEKLMREYNERAV